MNKINNCLSILKLGTIIILVPINFPLFTAIFVSLVKALKIIITTIWKTIK